MVCMASIPNKKRNSTGKTLQFSIKTTSEETISFNLVHNLNGMLDTAALQPVKENMT